MLSNSSSLLSVFWDRAALKAQQIAEEKTDYLPIQQTITTLFEAVIRILKWVIAGTTSGLRNRC